MAFAAGYMPNAVNMIPRSPNVTLERFLVNNPSPISQATFMAGASKRIGALVASTAVIALTLTACSVSTDASGESDANGGALRVVTTTTQLTDFVSQVGGDDIQLTGLLTPGGSAHSFDPTPADLLALGQADALVINGVELESFIDSAVEASGFSGVIINASDGLDLVLAEQISAEAENADVEHQHDADHEHATDHEHDAVEHTAEEHSEAAHGHDEHSHDEHSHDEGSHDGHDHGPINPHLWTSPLFVADMVHHIAHELGELDPAHAADFDARAQEYGAQLEALDAWISSQYAQVAVEDRVLVTGHDSLRYYLHQYEIGFAGSLLPSFADDAEPSAAEIDQLVQAIQDRGVQAIFVESSLSPKLAQTVGAAAGITVVSEDALYVDSLGPEGSGAHTYLDSMVHNTRVILEAWGVTPTDLPAVLQPVSSAQQDTSVNGVVAP